MPRGGAFRNTWQAAQAYFPSFTLRIAHTTHTYQIPSQRWGPEDPCPPRTNEWTCVHCIRYVHTTTATLTAYDTFATTILPLPPPLLFPFRGRFLQANLGHLVPLQVPFLTCLGREPMGLVELVFLQAGCLLATKPSVKGNTEGNTNHWP